MVRALLWKEWREQRIIAAAGLFVGVLLPVIACGVILSATPGASMSAITATLPALLALLVWPLFAVLIGASAINDSADGALGFLLSRPVSASRLWAIKVVSAAVALVLIVTGSLAFAVLFDVVFTGGRGFGSLFSGPLESSGLSNPAIRITLLMLPGLGLACGAFFATLLRRPLSAAVAGGIATTIAAWAGIMWAGLIAGDNRLSDGSERFYGLYFLALTVILLVAGWLLFRCRVMLPGANRHRLVMATFVGVLVAAVLGTHVAAALATRPGAGDWTGLVARLPGGDGIVLSVRRDAFTGESLWLAEPEQEARRLTGRMAHSPTVNADGQRIVYQTNAGRFGWHRERCELRIMNIAGGADRHVLDDVLCGYEAVFSPDGAWIAVSTEKGLAVAALGDGRELRHFATPSRFGSPLTFTADAGGVVWRASGGRDEPDQIVLIDLLTGGATPLFADREASRTYVEALTPRHVVVDARYATQSASTAEWTRRRSLVLTETGTAESSWIYGRELRLIELATNVSSPLPSSCPAPSLAVAFVDGGERLAFSDCGAAGDRGDLVVRDLTSGDETVLASFEWPVAIVDESPSGRTLRVMVRDQPEDGSASEYHTFMVTLDGLAAPFEQLPDAAWEPEGWLDDDHLLLSRRRSYARFNVHSGEVQRFGEPQ